jgi:hypothetical protein
MPPVEQQCDGVEPERLVRVRHRSDRQRERRERHDALAVEPELFSAGREDDETRRNRKHGTDQLGARREHVLAVVEDDELAQARHRPEERRRRWHARLLEDADRVRPGRRDVRSLRHAGELDEHYAITKPARRGRHLQRQPGLPDAASAGDGDEVARRQLGADIRELAAPADEACDRLPPGRVHRHAGIAWAPVELRLVQQDRLFERDGLGAWLHAQVFVEPRRQLLECPKRLSLAAAAVLGEHQLGPPPLSERRGVDQDAELGDDAVVVPAREPGVGQVLLGVLALLDQCRRRGLAERAVKERAQGVAAPEREGCHERVGGAPGLAGHQQLVPSRASALEVLDVRGLARSQGVATLGGGDRRGPEEATHLGDRALDHLPCGGRRDAPDERLDRPGRHLLVGVQAEDGQHVARAAGEALRGLAIDLERAEQAEPHVRRLGRSK